LRVYILLLYIINKSNASSADSIPLNSFHSYFFNLENDFFQTVNDDVESFCVNNNVKANNKDDNNIYTQPFADYDPYI